MDWIINCLTGQLTASERIWSAAAPALIIFSYLFGGLFVFRIRCALRGSFQDPEIAGRGSSLLLGMPLRHYFVWITRPAWRLLRLTALPPLAVTTLSVLLASAAAVSVGAGRFALGGWLYVFSGLCDFFDGRLARATDSASPAGEALDSILDRYSDMVMLVGLAWYYRESWVLIVIGVLGIGTSLIPYIRARGASLGVEVKVGVMQRPERMVLLGFAVALSPILEALYVPRDTHPMHYLAVIGICLTAVSSMMTAVRRFLYLLSALNSKHDSPGWGGTDKASLLRFSISSVVATAIDFVAVLLLVKYSGLVPWLATFLGCGIGAVLNFMINRFWAFGSHESAVGQIFRYGFVSSSSAMLNAGGVAVLLSLPTLDFRIAWAIARVAVYLFWNYPLNRHYVFGRPDNLDLSDAMCASNSPAADSTSDG